MKNYLKSLFLIFLLTNVILSSFAQRGKPSIKPHPEIHPIDKPIVHPHVPKEIIEILEKGNPYKKNSSKEAREDYCRALSRKNELGRISYYNNPKNLTEDISKLIIFISNVPILEGENKDYNNTQFYDNYDNNVKKLEKKFNAIDYKNYEVYFNTAFGKNNENAVKENAIFIFEIGSVIGKNEREILTKSKKTFLQFPDGIRECVYSEKNDKLYYKNGNHFMEQPRSIEEYLIIQEANERKMVFEKNVIISFINDQETERRLKEKFGNDYIKIDNQEKFKSLPELLSNHKNDRIILVGHIEENGFASNKKSDFDFQLSFNEIDRIQADKNLCLYTLGCNSITNGSKVGFSKNINSTKVVDAIYNATQKETHCEFFDAMSIGDNKFFVNTEFIGNQIRFAAEFKKYVEKVIKEINEKIERNGEISKAIVYSRLIETNDDPSDHEPKETSQMNDENTPLNILFRVLGIIIGFSDVLWLLIKITLYNPKSKSK